MPQRITIQFPGDRDHSFYARVWHLAEELYRAIDMRGMGVVHDVDQVRETLRIDVHKRQDLGEVMQILMKSIPRHFPGGEGEIIRGEPPGSLTQAD